MSNIRPNKPLPDLPEEDEIPKEEEKKKPETTEEELMHNLRLFHKVAGFYGWDWESWSKTPHWVKVGLCKILDEPGEDLTKFTGWLEYAMYRNLLRLYGTGDKKD